MDIEITKSFLLSCHEAKRITERMPKLPQGMKPSHIHILEIINKLQYQQETVRISDIGKTLKITNPSITKLINELLTLHLVEKKQDLKDKRVFTLVLTSKGKNIYEIYGFKFHHWLNNRLDDLPSEDLQIAIRVIHRIAYELEHVKIEFKETL
jgi:DNA-binding MarR family transcriptional regulator